MTADAGQYDAGRAKVDGVHGGRLFAGIERFGDAAALILANGSSLSYSALAERADACVATLGGTRALISVEMRNQVEPIAFYIGALRAGHVVIPNAGSHNGQAIGQVFNPNASYASSEGGWTLKRSNHDTIDLSEDLAVLLSTSGSTGSQKFVRLSHRNLISNSLAISDYLQLRPGERAITSLPAHYSFGLSILHSHLLLGHTVVLNERSVSEPEFWETVERERVTSLAGVPHSYQLLELGGVLDREFPDLRYLTQAGGRLAPEAVQRFAQWADRSGKRFYVMYGQTEAAPRMAFLPPADAFDYPDCVGVAIPGGAFRLEPIADADDLPAGAGELVYSGPNVMMGYAHARADLAGAQGSDEIRTGDIAVCNDRGYYRIVGRISRFAKLFGLRVGFDDIERRLSAAGMNAAVTGDDSGIVIATTSPGSAERISALLAQDLAVPATLISIVEVDEIPRLASGKTDYQPIRACRPQLPVVAPSSLADAISKVLGQEDLDPRWSFSELGGDSLNYVEMVLTLEEFLGYVPDKWENMPIRDLAALQRRKQDVDPKGEARAAPVSIQGLDLGRSLAIFLALLAHSFSQVGFVLAPEISFLPRLATPMLIMLFGAMIVLLYVPRAAQSDPGEAFGAYLTKSIQCYTLYGVNVLAIWLTDPSAWRFALGSLALLGSMPYVQILVFYTIMFLLIPAILFALKRVNFWILLAASLAVHAAFIPLKTVPAPPTLGGQPVLQRLLDLVVGAGAAPEVWGPSILHSFVLLLAGCWIGKIIRRSADRADPRRYFVLMQVPLAAAFAAALLFAFQIPAYPVDWTGLANQELRKLNHPAYIFIFGGMSLVLLSALLVSRLSARAPRWMMTIGRRSLFGFGIGNAIIVLWPKGGFAVLPPVVDGLVLLSFVILLIFAFDYCQRAGPAGPAAARWVAAVTNWGSRSTAALAGRIVRLARRGGGNTYLGRTR